MGQQARDVLKEQHHRSAEAVLAESAAGVWRCRHSH